jgi:NAD(P)-dependent dehydrogenase (short-subunit alcohol dehydrogenase family)
MANASSVETTAGHAMDASPASGRPAGRLRGKVAVITGGGQGLGRTMAETFAAEGARLVLASRAASRLRDAGEALAASGADVLPMTCDVASEADVERLFEATGDRFGRVDVLVNNAAVSGPTCAVVDLALEDWNRTLAVDLTGQFLCARAAARRMVAQGSGVNRINASVFGPKRPYPLRAAYAASKAGLVALTRTMAVELGPHGIRVNAMCPGAIEGERVERVWEERARRRGVSAAHLLAKMTALTALKRIPRPDELARLALFLVCDEASAITGQAINLCGGLEMH